MSFRVDLDQLDAVVAHLQSLDDRIAAELDTLDRHVAHLQSLWHGSAADAQRQAHDRWLAGAAEMRTGLQAMRDAGATAHANSTAAITANVTMWS